MAEIVTVQLEVKGKDATDEIKKLNKEIEELKKAGAETTEGTEELSDSIEDVGSKAKKSKSGLKSLATGFKNIGKAYLAAGFGAIVAVFGFLFNALKENQKVIDAFNTAFEAAAIVGKQVSDVIVSVYENVSGATENFDALGKVLKGVLDIALAPIKITFQAIKGAIIGAQLAWEQSWLGGGDEERIAELKSQLDEVGQEFINIKDNVVDAAGSIVNNFSEAVSEAGSIANQVIDGVKEISVEAAIETAKTNIALKKAAEINTVVNQGLIEKYEAQAEIQRQLRDDEFNTIEERLKANEKVNEIIAEQEKLMKQNVDTVLAAAEAQFKLTGKDEDYVALLEAKNQAKALETQIEQRISEKEQIRNTLLKERLALEESDKEALAIRQQAERDFNAEMIENEVTRLKQQQENAVIEKELEEKRLIEKRDSYKKGTQAFQDAQNELDAYSEASARNQVKIQKDLDKAKEQQMTQTLGNLATIVGANSKFGKAIAIVSAIRDTYAGANKALAQGGIFGFIGAAAVIAGGIANVKQITSTPEPAAPAGATSGGAMAVPPTPSMPPAFNIVGQGETSQLADAIGTQAQEPVRAYVVSNDVTTAQGLERNIVEGASI
jgi:chromosome segregation ATPase